MIGVQLHGRLGNQMFQYAFACSIAKKLNISFYLDEYIDNFILTKYFKLPGYNHQFNRLIRKWNKISNPKFLKTDGKDNPAEILLQVKNNMLYSGFFQSEVYFNNYKNEIKKAFKIKKSAKREFNNKYNSFFADNNKIVAIHIRRSDYLVLENNELGGKDFTLPLSFYNNCLKIITKFDDFKVIFVSDDIEYVKNNFEHKSNFFFESNNEMIDFQILMNADVLIISNSSFSWWAAYLNNKSNKVIYAPKYWLGFKIKKEYPVRITSPAWNWIEVE